MMALNQIEKRRMTSAQAAIPRPSVSISISQDQPQELHMQDMCPVTALYTTCQVQAATSRASPTSLVAELSPQLDSTQHSGTAVAAYTAVRGRVTGSIWDQIGYLCQQTSFKNRTCPCAHVLNLCINSCPNQCAGSISGSPILVPA